MNRKYLIAPSMLSSDFSNLETEIKRCEQGGPHILHLDIMDGHFVPNITFGPPVVAAIRKRTGLPLDCHLMISDPDKYIPAFSDAGADWISVHAEATSHLHRSLQFVKSFGKRAGCVLNPLTPIEFAFEAAEYCDFILLMSVNPGFGGQDFITSFFRRCEKLNTFLDDNGLSDVDIEVDGGIKVDNIKRVADAGANVFVSGSGVFSGDLKENIENMIRELNK